jgi:hypothetical protein
MLRQDFDRDLAFKAGIIRPSKSASNRMKQIWTFSVLKISAETRRPGLRRLNGTNWQSRMKRMPTSTCKN